MKNCLIALALLTSLPVLAQDVNTDKSNNLQTEGWHFGITPAMQMAVAPVADEPFVFAPDITFSDNMNVFGAGFRLPLLSSEDNGQNESYGAGVNYSRFLRNTHKLFDWYVFYSMEYYYGKETYEYYSGSSTPSVFESTTKSNYYNFIMGYGYHLNFSKNFYMDQNLGIGLSIQKINSSGYYDPYGNPRAGSNYTNRHFAALLRLGFGYKF